MSAEIKPGYKMTEVGAIPVEWDYVPILSVARLESGHTPSKSKPIYWDGDISWVSLHDTDALDGHEISKTDRTITKDGLDNSSARLLPAGTVVFSRTATVGKVSTLASPMATSQDFANYICGERLNNHFLVYLFRSMGRDWMRLMAGSIHNTIYMPVFKALKIVLPPVGEQLAIVSALSDIDLQLDGLERLLTKKRNLKQAAMQQLLTGQKRLPGFSGEWSKLPFGEIARPRGARVDPRRQGAQEFCIELEHLESGTGRLLGSTTANENASLKTTFQVGDVLFGKLRAYLRKFWLADRPGVCSTEIWALEPVATLVTADYLKQIVMGDLFIEAASNAHGTHMPRSDWHVVKNLEILLPAIEEQNAIATILSDMDSELAALEARRDKARQLKQGMMQELLTGRIRLLDPQPAPSGLPAPELSD